MRNGTNKVNEDLRIQMQGYIYRWFSRNLSDYFTFLNKFNIYLETKIEREIFVNKIANSKISVISEA